MYDGVHLGKALNLVYPGWRVCGQRLASEDQSLVVCWYAHSVDYSLGDLSDSVVLEVNFYAHLLTIRDEPD